MKLYFYSCKNQSLLQRACLKVHFFCIFQYKDIYNFPQKAFERVVEGEEVESESESEKEDGEKENELEEEMEEDSVSTVKFLNFRLQKTLL